MVFFSGGNNLLDPKKVFEHVTIPPRGMVADLGCGGAGHFVLPAAKVVGNNGLVYAVDIQKIVLASVISRARLMGISNIKTVWTNLEIVGAAKIPADSLDVAFLINTLFMSKKHDKIMEEAKRLLKPDGQLLVIDWTKISNGLGPALDDRVDPARIKQIGQQLGLSLTETFEAGPFHFGLVFKK